MKIKYRLVRQRSLAYRTQLLVAITLLSAIRCAQSQTVTATLPGGRQQ